MIKHYFQFEQITKIWSTKLYLNTCVNSTDYQKRCQIRNTVVSNIKLQCHDIQGVLL